MADYRLRPGDQPLPTPTGGASIHDMVVFDLHGEVDGSLIALLEERKRIGLERYGSVLQAIRNVQEYGTIGAWENDVSAISAAGCCQLSSTNSLSDTVVAACRSASNVGPRTEKSCTREPKLTQVIASGAGNATRRCQSLSSRSISARRMGIRRTVARAGRLCGSGKTRGSRRIGYFGGNSGSRLISTSRCWNARAASAQHAGTEPFKSEGSVSTSITTTIRGESVASCAHRVTQPSDCSRKTSIGWPSWLTTSGSTRLSRAGNGRDALRDAIEECADGIVYARQDYVQYEDPRVAAAERLLTRAARILLDVKATRDRQDAK